MPRIPRHIKDFIYYPSSYRNNINTIKVTQTDGVGSLDISTIVSLPPETLYGLLEILMSVENITVVAKSGDNVTATISEAISSQTPTSGNPHLILVCPGTYSENVTTTAYTIIKAVSPNSVYIDGDITIATNSHIYDVELGTNGSVISGELEATANPPSYNTYTVGISGSGRDYTSIKTAITEKLALPTSVSPIRIVVDPGDYTDTGTITIPSYMVVESAFPGTTTWACTAGIESYAALIGIITTPTPTGTGYYSEEAITSPTLIVGSELGADFSTIDEAIASIPATITGVLVLLQPGNHTLTETLPASTSITISSVSKVTAVPSDTSTKTAVLTLPSVYYTESQNTKVIFDSINITQTANLHVATNTIFNNCVIDADSILYGNYYNCLLNIATSGSIYDALDVVNCRQWTAGLSAKVLQKLQNTTLDCCSYSIVENTYGIFSTKLGRSTRGLPSPLVYDNENTTSGADSYLDITGLYFGSKAVYIDESAIDTSYKPAPVDIIKYYTGTQPDYVTSRGNASDYIKINTDVVLEDIFLPVVTGLHHITWARTVSASAAVVYNAGGYLDLVSFTPQIGVTSVGLASGSWFTRIYTNSDVLVTSMADISAYMVEGYTTRLYYPGLTPGDTYKIYYYHRQASSCPTCPAGHSFIYLDANNNIMLMDSSGSTTLVESGTGI